MTILTISHNTIKKITAQVGFTKFKRLMVYEMNLLIISKYTVKRVLDIQERETSKIVNIYSRLVVDYKELISSYDSDDIELNYAGSVHRFKLKRIILEANLSYIADNVPLYKENVYTKNYLNKL